MQYNVLSSGSPPDGSSGSSSPSASASFTSSDVARRERPGDDAGRVCTTESRERPAGACDESAVGTGEPVGAVLFIRRPYTQNQTHKTRKEQQSHPFERTFGRRMSCGSTAASRRRRQYNRAVPITLQRTPQGVRQLLQRRPAPSCISHDHILGDALPRTVHRSGKVNIEPPHSLGEQMHDTLGTRHFFIRKLEDSLMLLCNFLRKRNFFGRESPAAGRVA